jgi:hypothetical protein
MTEVSLGVSIDSTISEEKKSFIRHFRNCFGFSLHQINERGFQFMSLTEFRIIPYRCMASCFMRWKVLPPMWDKCSYNFMGWLTRRNPNRVWILNLMRHCNVLLGYETMFICGFVTFPQFCKLSIWIFKSVIKDVTYFIETFFSLS